MLSDGPSMRPSSDGNTFGSSSRPDLVRPVSQHSTTSTTSSTVAQQRSVPQPSRTQSALTDISSTMEWEVPRGSLPIQKDTHGYRGFEGQLPLPAQRSAHNHPQVPTHQRMHQATQSVSTDGTSFDNASTVNGDGKKKGAGTRKKKVQGPSQANGDELRRLLQENQGRGLNDVAKQVWRDEEGPKAEKSKQVFGMIWLSTHVVRRSNMSITRNKVYHTYVRNCTNHGIKHLNPASFGKLVHIIFEDLKTRRLGMRGESKYHYVELALVEDDGAMDSCGAPGNVMGMQDVTDYLKSADAQCQRPQLSADTAYFSPAESNARPLFSEPQQLGASTGVIWTQQSNSSGTPSVEPLKVTRPLRFTPQSSDAAPLDKKLDLPSIEPYLPQGTDSDAASSLVLVYHSHCKLAIDNFQHCRTALLRDGFKSFLGQLTRPGLDLLTHPSISAWIRECDRRKYQSMIPMLDRLLLMDVPRKGLAHIEQVAQDLCDWIVKYLSSQTHHVAQAMLDPARVFVSIIQRFLRVQRATRDVADVLEIPESRSKLWGDWIMASGPLAIVSSTLLLHDRGHKALLYLLTKEVRFLLSPEYDVVPTTGSIFEHNGVASDFQLRELGTEHKPGVAPVVARLFRFLADLPIRFHLHDARTLLNHAEVVAGQIIRNMALGGVADLHKWFQITLFINEALYWLAERGGMMVDEAQTVAAHPANPAQIDHLAASVEPAEDFDFSRPVTAHAEEGNADQRDESLAHGHPSPDFPTHRSAVTRSTTIAIRSPRNGAQSNGPARKRGHSVSTVGEDDVGGNGNDDSGIAMGMDDDFGDSKYHNFVQGLHGSDPADVVVC